MNQKKFSPQKTNPQTENVLHTGDEKFKYVFEHSVIGQSITLPSGEINVNPVFCEMLGYSQKDIQNIKWQEITHPDDVELTQNALDPLLSGEKESTRLIKRYIHKNSSIIWADVGVALRRDKDGNPLYFITSVSNITERKQVEETLRKLSVRQEAILSAVPDILMEVDQNKVYSWANPAGLEFFGEDVIGREAAFYFEGDQDTYNKVEPLFYGEQNTVYLKSWQRRNDGNKRLLAWQCRALKDEYGNIIGALSAAHDITERIQIENALHESEERFHSMFEKHAAIMLLIEPESGLILDANQTALRFYGYIKSEICAMSINDINMLPSEQVEAERQKALHEARNYFVFPHRLASGEKRIVEVHSSTISFREKQVLFSIIHDITKRKQAEKALQRNEEILRLFVAYSPAAIAMFDRNMKYIVTSKLYLIDYGLGEQNLIGRSHYEVFPEISEKWKEIHRRCMAGSTESCDEDPFPRADGELDWVKWEIHPWRETTGEIGGIILFSEVITKHKQMEEELKESLSLLRIAGEAAKLGGWSVNLENNRVIWSNEVAVIHETSLGFSPLVEEGINFYAPEWHEKISKAFSDCAQNGIRYDEEMEIITAKGRRVWVQTIGEAVRDDTGKIIKVHGAFQDITERKQIEEKIRQLNAELEKRVVERTSELHEVQEKLVRQEKLALLGQLAGGVGHELRNPLAVINNAIYFLKLVGAGKDEKVNEYLGIIETETRTAEKIITDLLDFARIKSVELEVVSVSELLHRTLERFPIPSSVDVTLKIPEGLPPVYVDPRQVIQVLGNLIVNAYQSMVSTITGALIVRKLSLSARVQDDMILIAVQDTGTGISPENLKKIFEPLFTTKAKGIGLGLAVSQKLVEANGGKIEVESETGKGSLFTVYLPAKVLFGITSHRLP